MEVNKGIAKDGTEILEVTMEDKTYRLNSGYRPYGEAEKFAAPFRETDSDSVLFFFGYGNGIIPQKIKEACHPDTVVIFYEPCKEIWEQAGTILEGGCIFVSGLSECLCLNGTEIREGKDFPLMVEELVQFTNMDKVQFAALPQYEKMFPKAYRDFVNCIQFRIEKIRSNAATAKAMGKEAVINNIRNMKYLKDSYCGDSFIHLFPKDMPAIIVAAGPSLEKNIKQLREAKGKALIVCVDSAVKYVLREGIVPDFLVCVDPKKPLDRFDGNASIKEIPLVVSLDTNYKVLDLLDGCDVIFASGDNDYVSSLYALAGHNLPRLRSGGSVATLAFSLCRYWGFTTIILVGQDLALTKNQMYAGGKELSVEQWEDKLVKVEDVFGETIYSPKDYYTYLRWFEQEISIHPELTVIDSTEGGARIKGSVVMPLSESLQAYGTKEYDIQGMITGADKAFDHVRQEHVEKTISHSVKVLEELIKRLDAGIRHTRDVLGHHGQGHLAEESLQDKKIEEITAYYNSLKEAFFIQREIDATVLDTYMNLFRGIETCDRRERYKRLQTYFELLSEAAKTVLTQWKQIR